MKTEKYNLRYEKSILQMLKSILVLVETTGVKNE